MTDDLKLPEVPEPKPEDPEDVSWALSTAEAMWARGDHSEGIKWVRRAAEAASEAESDERALELAKAAADLAGLVSRQVSRASIDLEEVVPESSPAPPPVPPARSSAAPKAVSKAPAAVVTPKALPTTAAKQLSTASRPPAPLPSQTSQAPAAPTPQASQAAPAAPSSARPSQPAGARGKPATTSTSKPASIRPGAAKKASRKSRENLDSEARSAVRAADAASGRALDDKSSTNLLPADTTETPAVGLLHGRNRTELGNNDPTVVGHVSDLVRAGAGDDFGATTDGDRQTVVGASLDDLKATMQTFPRSGGKPAPAAGSPALSKLASQPPSTAAASLLGRKPTSASPAPAPRAAGSEQHDPRIVTSQAVRVVVWRDASGVHVAPAGTVVSAITVDAVLVALEPNADLTAWLGGRDRT